MSFEGYYQLLCENGHETQGSLELTGSNTTCEYCGGKIIYHNLVDCTNNEDEGMIRFVEDIPSERTKEILPDGMIKRIFITGKYKLPDNIKPNEFPKIDDYNGDYT
jgi:hypothetical protein